jgi:uncharacterized protein (DUF433 family)
MGTPMRFDRVTMDPRQMGGVPCIRGSRLTVKRLVQLAALYPDRGELRREFPEVEDEDIRQALEYAAANRDDLKTLCAAKAKEHSASTTPLQEVREKLGI